MAADDTLNLMPPASEPRPTRWPSRRTVIVLVTIGCTLLALGIAGFLARRAGDRRVSIDPAIYEEVTRTFYRGLASLEVGLLENAGRDFGRVTDLVPDEPAGWANLGLTRARLGEVDAAAEPIERAVRLAGQSSDVALLAGQVETFRGQTDAGLQHLSRAVELDPRNLRARFALAEQTERSAGPNADASAAQHLDELLRLAPGNLVALLERTRLAVKLGDVAGLRDLMARLNAYRAGFSPAVEEQYRALEQAVNAGNVVDAARAIAFLRNVLAPTPAFQDSLTAIRTPLELIGKPFAGFLRLPAANSMPAPPDLALAYSEQSLGGDRTTLLTNLVAFSPDSGDAVAVVGTDGRELRRLDGAGGATSSISAARPGSTGGLLPLDWNHDFRTDIVTTGSDGVRLFLQTAGGTFADATDAAARSDGPLAADSAAAWAADIDMDGDLDIVVGVRDSAPVALRNNGDGTWRRLQPFAGVSNLRGFAWGDLDRDGDPDAALLDEPGDLHIFANRQAGRFERVAGPPGLKNVIAFALGDVNADGPFDLVTLDAAGSLRRSSPGTNESSEELAVWPDFPSSRSGPYRVFLSDVDNNGAVDIVASGASGSSIWLAGTGRDWHRLAGVGGAEIFSVADLDRDGDLDFVALSNRQPVRLIGQGQSGYHWQVIRPRAQSAGGDQRINSFGIGGDVEIRSGLMVQKQPIAGGTVHFGLGTHTGVDVAKILWPNGVAQAEFDRGADQVVVAQQRLKGSCPWVFTDDGTGMRFVTDFLWRSPLGLRINAQDTAEVTQTEDWIKLRGDQLVARDGFYDVRITADLWETHFIDHVSLMVVDHPEEVDMFVDERFAAASPPALAAHATSSSRVVPRAWDHHGRDVTALIAQQDGRYLGTFAVGAYQGIAEEHFVELEFDREIRRDRPVWLLAHGWIYPTDSSINVAIGQGRHPQPRGLTLEAQDDSGRWIVASGDLGFPAGKNKTILIDLSRVADAGVAKPRRLRLRTNLEIRWDWIAYADGADRATLTNARVPAAQAELRYRGFSRTSGWESREGPEVPAYAPVANVGQQWRDLVGYYTRFGDVRPLLTGVDDRYVIMNAGDELRLKFPAPPPPKSGWRRDFVLIGDGWVKDGDYNTAFSRTVHPLPSHQPVEDEGAAGTGEFEDDPVYRRYADDWQQYHTRFVTPRPFVDGLRRAQP
jgi:hypothetical protein